MIGDGNANTQFYGFFDDGFNFIDPIRKAGVKVKIDNRMVFGKNLKVWFLKLDSIKIIHIDINFD